MNNLLVHDFRNTDEFIQACEQDTNLVVTHVAGNTWRVTGDRGSVTVKRCCNDLPREQRGVLSYLAWGLGLATVFAAAIFTAPYWLPVVFG